MNPWQQSISECVRNSVVTILWLGGATIIFLFVAFLIWFSWNLGWFSKDYVEHEMFAEPWSEHGNEETDC